MLVRLLKTHFFVRFTSQRCWKREMPIKSIPIRANAFWRQSSTNTGEKLLV